MRDIDPLLCVPYTSICKYLLLVVCLGSFTQQISFGQAPFSTITGVVKDTSGAVIPEASVLVSRSDTNLRRQTITSDLGSYQFTNLLPGEYAVEIKAPGFRAEFRR